MGLAASQARLLTITARKSDCEFQSMNLSHQKIALARDMERISDEYQKALNQTKLVYDYYGSGLSQVNLDYNLLMSPSIYNDYYPKFVTDNKNRIVLDSKLAEAAVAAGIPAEGLMGTASSVMRNKFIEALADANVINAATAVNIKSIPYSNAIGLGAYINATTPVEEISYDEFLTLLKNNCDNTADYNVPWYYTGEGEGSASFNMFNLGFWSCGGKDNGYDDGKNCDKGRQCNYGENVYLHVYDGNGTKTNYFYTGQNRSAINLTLYDLLTTDNDYILTLHTKRGCANPLGEAAVAQQILVGSENSSSFLNWMMDQFDTVLGGVAINDQAIQYAYDQVYDLIYPNEKIQDKAAYLNSPGSANNGHNKSSDRITQLNRRDISDYLKKDRQDCIPILEEITATHRTWQDMRHNEVKDGLLDYVAGDAKNGIGFAISWIDNNDMDNDCQQAVAIDLKTVAKVFFTAFMEYYGGLENSCYSYEKGLLSDAVLYEGDKEDKFLILGETEVDNSSDHQLASFYDTLFNILCTQGWTMNDKIATDSEYMQEMLKTGAVYISSINNDGKYYQSSYSTDTFISEVADQDGVAQAEAKYNTEKSKIESKENKIDVKMKNLDAEISSLTTEYDTVKSIINKAIEKSFKRYDA